MRATEALDIVKNGFNPERELRMSHLDSKDSQVREVVKLTRRALKKMDRVNDLFNGQKGKKT